MATPLSAEALLSALRAEGLDVVEYEGWRTHNRNSRGAWGPAHGVMLHHTVSSGTDTTVRLCRDGHGALTGPLCHGVIAKDGRVYLVGHGRASHAGRGDPAVHRTVREESYGAIPPWPTEDSTDGDAHFYGFECVNLGDGRDPWPEPQLDAMSRVCAALCRAHGWSAKATLGHLEWTRRKNDPRGFGMASMRARVATRLSHQPGWSPGAVNGGPPAISNDDADRIAARVWHMDGLIRNPDPASSPGHPHIAGATAMRNIELVVRRLERKLTAQTTAIEQLAAALAEHHTGLDADQLVCRVREAIDTMAVGADAED